MDQACMYGLTIKLRVDFEPEDQEQNKGSAYNTQNIGIAHGPHNHIDHLVLHILRQISQQRATWIGDDSADIVSVKV